MSKPEGVKKWGTCRGCGEDAWLYEYEETEKDPENLMCEGCIDEYHARVHEAEDALAGVFDSDDFCDTLTCDLDEPE